MSVRRRPNSAQTASFSARTRPLSGFRDGVTLTEVVVAAGLLLVAVVPILRALTIGQTTGTAVERRTRSLALAQGKLDELRARSVYHYDESWREDSTVVDEAYLCTVTDDRHPTRRLISVSVGYDRNEDGALANDEIEVTLTTYVARR
jgi:Tfp pilus assembly protein PilV